MASPVQNHLRKFDEILKGYLYEGPLVPFWGLIEQKTKVKRERIALGISIVLLLMLSYNYLLFN
jgi:hypothetical protein